MVTLCLKGKNKHTNKQTQIPRLLSVISPIEFVIFTCYLEKYGVWSTK